MGSVASHCNHATLAGQAHAGGFGKSHGWEKILMEGTAKGESRDGEEAKIEKAEAAGGENA